MSDHRNNDIIDDGKVGDVHATGSDYSTIKGSDLILQHGNIRVEATLVLADAVTVFDQGEFDSSSRITLTIGAYAFFVDFEDSEDDIYD